MKEPRITVLLNQKGIGVVAFQTLLSDEVEAVKEAMNKAFELFPQGKFGLFGFEKTDGTTTITETKYLGKVSPYNQ